MKALIFKSTGSFYQAQTEDGQMWTGRLRGKLKIAGDITSTNPIAVGDYVEMSIENEQTKSANISKILDRDNYLVRTSPQNRHQKHIIAANLDLAVLIATIKDPRTSFGFIDRFLLTAEAYHVPVLIVFNKIDQIEGKYLDLLNHKKEIYEDIGYAVLEVSAIDHTGIPELKEFLKGKTALFTGHSGVGKSTLINCLAPSFDLKVGAVSDWSGKGQHTTTFAEMFETSFGAKIIDTPGIKEWGIVDVEKAELAHYFKEMNHLLPHCKFNNCIHINEPGCAVKSALQNEEISLERYESYLNLIEEIE